jgi:DNA-3-methyladenine glycosylase
MTHACYAPLPRSFYARDPVAVARDLIHKQVVRRTREGITRGRIVEVEAYLGQSDSAAHSYRGKTPRNLVMFGPPGKLYVYSIHARYCMNAVTGTEGVPTAVLIRAVEPLQGLQLMRSRRHEPAHLDLARGPARLCEAFSVNRKLNGWDLTGGRKIWFCDATNDGPEFSVAASPRIGVTSAKDLELRFFVDGSRFVSGPRRFHS